MDNNKTNFAISMIAGLFTTIIGIYLERSGFITAAYLIIGLSMLILILLAINFFLWKKQQKQGINKTPSDNIETKIKQNLKRRNGLIWFDGDQEPCCPRCWEAETKQIHLKPHHKLMENGKPHYHYACTNCSFTHDLYHFPH